MVFAEITHCICIIKKIMTCKTLLNLNQNNHIPRCFTPKSGKNWASTKEEKKGANDKYEGKQEKTCSARSITVRRVSAMVMVMMMMMTASTATAHWSIHFFFL